MYGMGYSCLAIKKDEISFCLCNPFIGFLVMCVTVWFNGYSIIELFDPFLPLWRRYTGLAGDFLLFIFPNTYNINRYREKMAPDQLF